MPRLSSPTRRTIMIVVDGLRDDKAAENLGVLEGLVDSQRGSRFHGEAVLPSVSRPAYEALMTGAVPSVSGITSNDVVRRSRMVSIFDLAKEAGITTVATGYYFFSELYVHAPYDPVQDGELENGTGLINYGRFYLDGNMPDFEVLCQAERIRQRTDPGFMLIHLNHTDEVGHRHGGNSPEYATYLHQLDHGYFGRFVPQWLEAGYTVVVTADHGMSASGQHGGTEPAQRRTPIYLLGSDLVKPGRYEQLIPEETIAAMVCQTLGLDPAPSMDQALIHWMDQQI